MHKEIYIVLTSSCQEVHNKNNPLEFFNVKYIWKAQMSAFYLYTYLSNHDREGKDSNKVVDELEDNLKQGGGVWQTTNGDQCLHRKVVTANVTEQRQRQVAREGGRRTEQGRFKIHEM